MPITDLLRNIFNVLSVLLLILDYQDAAVVLKFAFDMFLK